MDFRLGSARDLFSSARKKNQLENRKIVFSLFPLHFQRTSLSLVFFAVNLLFLHNMTDSLVQKLVKSRKKEKNKLKKPINQKKKKNLARFSSKIEMSELGSAPNHYSSARLSSGNSSSSSSLLPTHPSLSSSPRSNLTPPKVRVFPKTGHIDLAKMFKEAPLGAFSLLSLE